MFIICWKCPKKVLETPPNIFEAPQMTTHQSTPQNRLIYTNRYSQRQDSKYVIYILINMWR
jgi:hypothetical protein